MIIVLNIFYFFGVFVRNAKVQVNNSINLTNNWVQQLVGFSGIFTHQLLLKIFAIFKIERVNKNSFLSLRLLMDIEKKLLRNYLH